MGRKKKINKEEIAEDWCFDCKDGGLLRVCDYKDCLKAFHPRCVGKDDSFLESEVPWSCKWHFCFDCKKVPKFHCFCCSKAVCGCCLYKMEFAVVRGNKGFCIHCLTLAGFIEGIKNDEGKIDFSAQDTYEFMFKSYWEMVKKKEGLTSEHVHYADKLLNKGRNSGYVSDSNDTFEGEEDVSDFEDENQLISDNDDLNDRKGHKVMKKGGKNRGNPHAMKRKVKSKKKQFNGWGSNLLLDFLASIGKDTTQELSQHDVADIIIGYCSEHKLFDPVKKKKVVCDERLKSLLRRKLVNRNSIHNLLTPHFADNFEESEDEFGYSSEDKGENVSMACKRQRKSSTNRKFQNKEAMPDVQQGYFASVVAENIRLLYLKRSLVEELSKQPETFDAKVIGSFVRIRSDPFDYLQKNYHQLLKVTGIKRTSRIGEVNADILLQVSNIPKDIPICELSDDNFSQEECEDLRQRVKDGRLERPTVVEFKEKARSLHKVITNHWIVKELALLQNRINQANEKGWRRELFEYIERMLLLEKPSEQSRLLDEVPEIIADEAEVESADKDLHRKDVWEKNASPESDPKGFSKPSRKVSVGKGISSCLKDGTYFAEQKQQSKGSEQPKRSESWELVQQHHTDSGDDSVEVKQNRPNASHPDIHPELSSALLLASVPQGQSNSVLSEKQHQSANAISVEKDDESVDIEHEKVKNKQIAKTVEAIELSDDEDHDTSIAVSKPTLDNPNSSVWHVVSPNGIQGGPYSMALLKEWSNQGFKLKLKVWKTGQSPEEAILLTDAIHQFFPENREFLEGFSFRLTATEDFKLGDYI